VRAAQKAGGKLPSRDDREQATKTATESVYRGTLFLVHFSEVYSPEKGNLLVAGYRILNNSLD